MVCFKPLLNILLIFLLTIKLEALFINELKREIRQDLDMITENKYGRQIMMVLKQQLEKETRQPEQIVDIVNELEGDVLSDQMGDKQEQENTETKCIQDIEAINEKLQIVQIEIKKKPAREDKLVAQTGKLTKEFEIKQQEVVDKTSIIESYNYTQKNSTYKYLGYLESKSQTLKILNNAQEILQAIKIAKSEEEKRNLVKNYQKNLNQKETLDNFFIQFLLSTQKTMTETIELETVEKLSQIVDRFIKDTVEKIEKIKKTSQNRTELFNKESQKILEEIKGSKKDMVQLQDYIDYMEAKLADLQTGFAEATENQKIHNKEKEKILKFCDSERYKYKNRENQREIQLTVLKKLKNAFQVQFEAVCNYIKDSRVYF